MFLNGFLLLFNGLIVSEIIFMFTESVLSKLIYNF